MKKILSVALLFCLIFPVFSKNSEKRTALLMANEKYSSLPQLYTPVKEARELEKTLKSLGFEVTVCENATLSAMEWYLETFKRKLVENGGIGFFHYGGHAIQVDGKNGRENYLIPVNISNADTITERQVCRESLEMDIVLDSMHGDTNIIVIDACRNNPFIASGSRSAFTSQRGLSLVKDNLIPKNSIVVFSASDGQTAQDGIFTPILTKHLTDKNHFLLIMIDVRKEVYEKTGRRQEPICSDKLLSGELYLAGIPSGQTVTSQSASDFMKNVKTDYMAFGKEEYENRNYKQAFEYFTQAEQNKQYDCYLYLAALYEKGNGVIKDLEKAFKYYEKAAKSKNIEAQLKIADMYSKGEGVTKNLKKSFEWNKKAADSDNLSGILKTAEAYDQGIGTGVNLKNAFNYYLKAAIKGDKNAQIYVGKAYLEGTATKKDLEQSKHYLEMALKQVDNWNENKKYNEIRSYLGEIEYSKCADLLKKNDIEKYISTLNTASDYGYKEAEYELGMICLEGKYNRSKDEYTARSLFCRAAGKGLAEAQFMAGKCYHEGIGGWTDYNTAAEYYEKAVEQNNPKACNNLGNLYMEGKGVYVDYVKAGDLFLKAVDLGLYDFGYFNLGRLYFTGNKDIPQDNKKAYSYFIKAEKYNHPSAGFYLAQCYDFGYGVAENKKTALKYYLMYADTEYDYKKNDNSFAQLRAGIFYYNGWGTKKNNELSRKYLIQAYNHNQYSAQEYLGRINYDEGKALEAKAKTEEDWEKVIKCYRASSNLCYSSGYYELAVCYHYGKGVQKDTSQALKYYKYVAESDKNPEYVLANLAIGNIYNDNYHDLESGYGDYKWRDYGKYYQIAAEAGNPEAMYKLAIVYKFGSGSYYINSSTALTWMKKSAEAGFAKAQYEMAWAYHAGRMGCEINETVAKQWLKKAYKQNDEDAVLCYKKGWDAATNKCYVW